MRDFLWKRPCDTYRRPYGTDVIHHLHARVDNLVIIDPSLGSEEDFNSFNSSLIWHSNAGGDATATNLYRHVDLLFNNPVEDGFAWWILTDH